MSKQRIHPLPSRSQMYKVEPPPFSNVEANVSDKTINASRWRAQSSSSKSLAPLPRSQTSGSNTKVSAASVLFGNSPRIPVSRSNTSASTSASANLNLRDTLRVFPRAVSKPIKFLFVTLNQQLYCATTCVGLPELIKVKPSHETLLDYHEKGGLKYADISRVRGFFKHVDNFRALSYFHNHCGQDSYLSIMFSMFVKLAEVADRALDVLEAPPQPVSQSDRGQSHWAEKNNVSPYPEIEPIIKLRHLSNEALGPFRDPVDMGTGCKPLECLWLGCGYEWQRYYRDEGLGWHKYETTFTLDTSRLIILDTEQKLIDFEERFRSTTPLEYLRSKFCIDWEMVRNELRHMSGIFIPRPWEFERTTTTWTENYTICSAALWSDECVIRQSKPKLQKRLPHVWNP